MMITLGQVGSAMAFGLRQGANFALGLGSATGHAAFRAGQAGVKIGRPIVTGAGDASMKFFHGAGTALAENLRDPAARSAIASTWGSKTRTLGDRFVTGDRGNMRFTALGVGALGVASMVDNGRDIYDQNKARNMGEINSTKVTNTPSMTMPQYELSPKKRMGALDGGASGSLAFALWNNR